MFFSSKKKHYVEEQFDRYIEEVIKCKESFREGMHYFIDTGKVDEQYLQYMEEVNHHESAADDIRDNLEIRMYEQALIPESRGDVLALMENLDFLPNRLESIMRTIEEMNITIPELEGYAKDDLLRNLRSLVGTVLEAMELALDAGKCFFYDSRRVRDFTVAIDRIESEGDELESKLTRIIFRADGFTDLQRICFSSLVKRLADVADLAERFHRRITLLTLKHLY